MQEQAPDRTCTLARSAPDLRRFATIIIGHLARARSRCRTSYPVILYPVIYPCPCVLLIPVDWTLYPVTRLLTPCVTVIGPVPAIGLPLIWRVPSSYLYLLYHDGVTRPLSLISPAHIMATLELCSRLSQHRGYA